MTVRMIAVDLDGTLLLPDHTVSERTVAALRGAQAAGIVVLAATGRPAHQVAGLLPDFLQSLVVCSNGALVWNQATGEVLLERAIAPAVQRAFVGSYATAVPGVVFGVQTDAGRSFVPGPGYLAEMRPGDHGRDPASLTEADLDALTARPAVKLVARRAGTTAEELLAAAEALHAPGVTCTVSGVPFLEVAAAGVSKESALAIVGAWHGITADQVLAFGDSINDLGMLRWAGWGVAMGNALPLVSESADEVTAAHVDDGVALVVERILRAG